MPFTDALNFYSTAPRRPSPVVLPSPNAARICATAIVGGIMFLLASGAPAPAAAQTAAPATQTGACEEPPHTAATPPAHGPDSGTKPGSEGSTAWSGGSYTGLTPHAGTPASPTRQPDTVSGVNPKPEPQGKC
ncbi:hypothetical protein [Xanthobacter sp. 126]|uniref:hypothetical protein n=1 Tax=Xanthobacter sp. 126 TaxID=1131814 RepID=UPI00045E5AD0|nr:hypothetical protein [Xanthobacter sp. 126]